MRELFLNVGRVISISLLVVLAKDLESVWIPIVLFSMAVLQYLLVLCVRKDEEE